MDARRFFRGGIGIIVASILAFGTGVAQGQCVLPDNGSGTVDLPPIGVDCGYLSPTDVHTIIAGLPPGTTIRLGAEHNRFGNVITTPGGPLGGEREQFTSEILLHLVGTGELTGYSRTINLVNVQVITDTAPRGTGAVQSFDTDMFMMQGQLPPGDPDFDLLTITAGTQFGMPSPGHTTLTRQGGPGSPYTVDSFFDITYRIDFVGGPGGPLGGMSGSTTGTIRMQNGGGTNFCCMPNGFCQPMQQAMCVAQGGSPVSHCPPDGLCVPPGDDCFFTQCGQTQFNFCDNPIPADFFNPGSEPFIGRIELQGASPTSPDTVVRRSEAALLDGPAETVPIELVELHLSSCQPITVTDTGGGVTLWDVEVELSATPVAPGHVTILKSHSNGGTFDASFPVQPLFVFTEVGNPGNVRVLDTGAAGMPPTQFDTTGSPSWVHQTGLPTPQCGVNFVPGVQEDPATGEQCCTETCHDNPGGGHKHCTKRCFVCPRGACCDPISNSCTVTEGAALCPGTYMGDGTNCNDSDGDGLADVFEINDCCEPSGPCRVASNPNNPDTDGDGVLDGDELALGCDPCVPDCGTVSCCLPLGGCTNLPLADCEGQGGAALPAGSTCQGDNDGDGIDDACYAPPCVQCGPGPHWIDVPGCPPGGSGQDTLPSGAVLGIDTNFDCIADTNVIAGGPATIRKLGNFDDATFFPGTRPIDGHLDVIDTEIIGMSLTGGGVTLRAGTMSGSAQPLQASRGVVAEQPSNPNLADSFFDVFFEIEISPGTYGYNHAPIRVAQTIDCMPPKGNYYHLGGCVPLYSSPIPGAGVLIGNLVQANHFTYPSCCSSAFPGGCANNIPVSQCQGTPVPNCLGDNNANGVDDACDPQCTRDPTTPTGCSELCPPPVGANDQCLPVSAGCNPHQAGSCGVLTCECQDPTVCHLVSDATGYHCEGGCPNPPGGTCTLLGTGAFDNPMRCDCVGSPGCVPNADASDCEPAACPNPAVETCHKKCVKIDADGNVEVTDCECEPANDCHVEIHQGPLPRGVEGGVAGGASNGCIVADNGSGTVNLPPLDVECGYLSPDDVHMIIDGLPPGTTIVLGAEHHRFGNVIITPGGSLGGEVEQFTSDILLEMEGTGDLAGYNRIVSMSNVPVETHTAPRGTGSVQSFDTDMFAMQGQLPPGDPDFDLLRITAGTNYGMPSPGHTTLTRLPGGSFAVDSFFDITYRIDFVGAPGGPLAGMSGSTTATIRMQTTPPVKCTGDCPPGTTCEQTNVLQADGTHKICCDCVDIPPQDCAPNATGTDCNPVQCPVGPPPSEPEFCRKKCVAVDAAGNVTLTDCECQPEVECHMQLANNLPRSVGMEFEGGVAGGPNGCIVPDDGGTVDLPPVGCDYLSPDDVHMIIDGLPAGTTINLAPIHTNFICNKQQGGVCSFPPGVDCEQAGGSLGGEKECSDSTLHFDAQCTGPGCNGFGPRSIDIPLSFETHTAPRTPGDPVQSFDTDMFRMFGQITGDPDFDLLRVVGGTDFGLPSPGHTTLTQLPGGNWAVDSFFDIAYRIDFVGRPGGPLGGMSGSTTGTIRMQTNSGFKCRGACPANTECVQTSAPLPDGTKKICCECESVDPTGVCCQDDGTCVNTTQAQCQGTFLPGMTCSGIMVACCLPNGTCANMDEVCCAAAGGNSIVGASCTAPQACCFTSGLCQNLDPVCCAAQSGTPGGAGSVCLGDLDGDGVDEACDQECAPTPDGTGCTDYCPSTPVQEECHQRCANFNPQTGQITVTACDCRGETACRLVYPGGGAGRDDGGETGVVAGGPNGCIVPDNGGGTVTLPPAGCDYLSPDDVHMIIDGLPPGTTLNLEPIHSQIFCREQNNVCSFPPGVDCTETGGVLGGEKECNASTLQFQATCVGTCPGGLAGFNRTITIPNVGFETHVAPRQLGQPSQSFDTQMFRLFGQITGDPDFDLLRVVAGNDFGLPSPGHTTLTRLPDGSFAVDSFFDITYRIDFVGSPGGALSGMSGSTTATIRMGTTPPFKCIGGCGLFRRCTPRAQHNVDGTVTVCCDCRPRGPIRDLSLLNKSRFISFSLAPAGAVAGGGDEEHAIRVRLVSLHHVDPPYTGGPSIPFTAFEGEVRYAGPPAVFVESTSSGVRFVASQLQCAPHYRDWTAFNSCSMTPTICTTDGDCPMGGTCTVPVDSLLHVTGSAITPSSVFEVEVLGEICAGNEEACEDVSDALEIITTRWGDVAVAFNPPSTTAQPDLTDIAALVNKFRSAPGAPIKARALLNGSDAFGTINIVPDLGFSHIARCVDAFRGMGYPFTIEACP